MSSLEDRIARALLDPEASLVPAEQEDCKSFSKFVDVAWPVLEPGTPLVRGWAFNALVEHLQAITDGQIRKLLICLPPGISKSSLLSVLWPAYEWGPAQRPYYRYINASYDKRLAVRDMLRARDLMLSSWYQARWPFALKDDAREKEFYANLKTGWRLGTSIGGRLTGYRGDRMLIDDPHSAKKAESDIERANAVRWLQETAPTRINNPTKSAMVVCQQRLHIDDCAGHIIDNGGPEWVKLVLPMEYEPTTHCKTVIGFSDPRTEQDELLQPERFPRSAVTELRRDLGEYAYQAQFQQAPMARGGGMFLIKHAQFIDDGPPSDVVVWCRGWDLAATTNTRAAATAGVKIGLTRGPKPRVIIADVRRIHGGPHEVEQLILNTARADGPNVIISLPQDPGQAGVAQKRSLVSLLQGFEVHTSPESGSKEGRATPLAAQWEGHNVWLVRAAWNDAYLDEGDRFTNDAKFKDQIDAAARAYAYLLTRLQATYEAVDVPGICIVG